jgi:segregation and condensation protein B
MEEQLDYKKLIEAALFMSPNALSVQDLSGITGIASVGHVEEMVKKLAAEYESKDTALEIIEIDKKFLFTLREPYASRVSIYASGPDISKGALRLLAYISKNNNVLQSDLVKIFGESTYEHMKELNEKEFVERRKEGRSRRITVTNKFKEYFSTGV